MPNIPVKKTLLPEGRMKPLMGFDYDGHLYHVALFDFGADGGAIGIYREGERFCARITLDSLAEFHAQAEAQHIEGNGA